MIKTPIDYEPAIAAQVAAFREEDKIVRGFWTDDEVNPVRKVIKDFYKEEQDYTCPYCGQLITVASGRAWDIDHIVPNNEWPAYMFEPLNLCVACIDCNTFKSDKNIMNGGYPQQYPTNPNRFKIAHPHFDELTDHIRKLNPCIFFAVTEKGRFTIDFCNLHRFGYKFSFNDETLSRLPSATTVWNTVMDAKSGDEIDLTVRPKDNHQLELKVSVKP